MRNVSSTCIPYLEGHIQILNTKYHLTGVLYFNGLHYWCEILSTQIGCKRGWYLYDGMIRGGKAEYVGEIPQCKRPEYVHILVYEQSASDPNVYGKTIAYEREKLNSIITIYKQELNLSDTKVKIKNLKEILRHEGVPFKNNAKLEELQTLVLNISEIKSQYSCNGQQISSDVEMKSPPSGKDIPFTKRVGGKPTASIDYTPERHPPKKFKKLFSPIKKSSVKKTVTKYIKTFKELVNKVTGPGADSSSEEETEQCQLTMQASNPFFKYLDEPLQNEIYISKSNDYLVKSFSSELPYQMVDMKQLWDLNTSMSPSKMKFTSLNQMTILSRVLVLSYLIKW